MQTESVSYVASRSETLSVFFVLAAFAVYLYRQTAVVSIPRILALLALFAAAALSKEHTVVLPALFILTDYYWRFEFSPSVIWRNWKLYVPIAAGAALALMDILRILRGNQTAGFQIQGLDLVSILLHRVPRDLGLHSSVRCCRSARTWTPISRSREASWSHGAIFGLAGLLAVSVLAWIYRRRFPIASYGWFVFLILLAPTSSFAPIRDPMAERRMYLPFIGLLFITVEFLRRWKASRNALIGSLALVLVVEGALTYQRNLLWGSAIDMWKDTVSKSPQKLRPRFQLAMRRFSGGRLRRLGGRIPKSRRTGAARTMTCCSIGRWPTTAPGTRSRRSRSFSRRPRSIPSAHVYSQIGMEYGKMGKYPEALDALATAQRLDPGFAMTYYYLGNIHAIQGNQAQARAGL